MEVLDILQKIGYTDLRDFGKEWRARPLYRPSDNTTSLCIKKSTGEWYDFSGRVGGGLAQLVQTTLGISFEDTKAFLGDTTIKPSSKNRYELSSVRKFDKMLLVKLQKDHTYWLNRRISTKTVEIFEGGITFNGRMAYRYVFPIFDERHDLIGFSGRSLTNNPDYPKWKHLGAKSNWLYPLTWNREILSEKREVILLESIGDMLALWENNIKNTIVCFGVDVSHKIVELLLKLDTQRIIVAFNNDTKNNNVGNEAAEDCKTKLLNFFDPQQVVIALPEAKDFGEMNAEQITLWENQLKNH
jgi:hypothetical protein